MDMAMPGRERAADAPVIGTPRGADVPGGRSQAPADYGETCRKEQPGNKHRAGRRQSPFASLALMTSIPARNSRRSAGERKAGEAAAIA